MGNTLESAPADEAAITFELDRLEFSDGDRLELSGRWFGVRGRRFMRPSLTLIHDGGEVRLLANLEHKPWAAESGEPWEAAFACTSGDVDDASELELTVSPDLTVKLPAPGAESARARPIEKRKPLPAVPRGHAAPAGKGAGPDRELAALRDRVESLKRELDGLRASFQSELGETQTAATEALLASERAMAERDRAIADRDRATEERDAGLADRDLAVANLDRLSAELDRLSAERDRALAASTQARSELDLLTDTYARLKFEHDQTIASYGAALVMRNATTGNYKPRREGLRLTIAIVAAMLVVVALVIAIAFH